MSNRWLPFKNTNMTININKCHNYDKILSKKPNLPAVSKYMSDGGDVLEGNAVA